MTNANSCPKYRPLWILSEQIFVSSTISEQNFFQLQSIKLIMVDEISRENFKKLTRKVHPATEGKIRSLFGYLDKDWYPFIPTSLQNDSYFTRTGYYVGNTFVPDMLEVVIRIHKVVEKDTLGMLTVSSYEENNTICVDCIYTMGIPNGFNSWSEIGGERKGNPVVIESRTVEYPRPTEGDRHSDEEVEGIVIDVIQEIKNLADEYGEITQEEVVQYY